jgi:hypothetical protein
LDDKNIYPPKSKHFFKGNQLEVAAFSNHGNVYFGVLNFLLMLDVPALN